MKIFSNVPFKFLTIFIFVIIFSEVTTETSSGTVDFCCVEGMASWYAEFSPGIRTTTANMEVFNDDELTCAIWHVPFDTILEVTNLQNGKKVMVRVNDRGPAKRLCRQGRVIDLAKAAFQRIADLDEGLINVRIRPVE